MKGKGLFILIVIAGIVTVGYRWLPSQYNPFVPLTLDDPPGKITQFKLRRLTPGVRKPVNAGEPTSAYPYRAVADSAGECPLSNVVRVRDFGPVSLNSSFLASCPLALSSALFVSQQARPLTKTRREASLRVLNIWAALPAAISTAARMRGAANMPRRMRWISALSGWQTDSVLPF